MDLRRLFNIILIGLTLSTILLTIVLYVVFKIRQSFQKQEIKDKHRMDGRFFSRVSPRLTAENEEVQKRSLEEQNKKAPKRPMKFAYAFAITFSCILLFFLLEDFFHFRLLVKEKTSAEHRNTKLRQQGLLQEFDYTPGINNLKFQETILETKLTRLKDASKRLSNQKIYLRCAQDAASKVSVESCDRWKALFGRYTIEFKSWDFKNLDFDKNGIFIFPQNQKLSNSERVQINSILEKGGKLLATGPMGVLSGRGTLNSEGWFLSGFLADSKLQSNLKANDNWPSTIRVSSHEALDLPSAFLFNWYPTDNRFQLLTNRHSNVFEATWSGRPRMEKGLRVARQMKLESDLASKYHGRILWSALDPIVKTENEKMAETIYADDLIIQNLFWLSGVPTVRLGKWPSGKAAATAVTLSAVEEFENLNKIYDIFKNENTPSTLFVVTDPFSQVSEKLHVNDVPRTEIASLSNDYTDLTSYSEQDNFSKVQKSRLVLEELSGQKIFGFSAPFDKFQPHLLNSLSQQNFSYIYGRQDMVRWEPVRLGPIFYIPRLGLDDIGINKKNELVSEKDVSNYIESERKEIARGEGLFVYNIHSHITSNSIQMKFFKLILRELNMGDYFFANFKEILDWIEIRDQVKTEVNNEGIVVTNLGAKLLPNFSLVVGDGNIQVSENLRDITPKDLKTVKIYEVNELKPKDVVKISWSKK